MKIRMTVVVDREISEQEAFEHYGAVDPYTVAQSLQTAADAKLRLEPSRMGLVGVEIVAVQVVPIG